MSEEIKKLEAQNAELSDRIAKLEEAAKPPKPFVPGPRIQFDRTEGACMPRSAMQAMIDDDGCLEMHPDDGSEGNDHE